MNARLCCPLVAAVAIVGLLACATPAAERASEGTPASLKEERIAMETFAFDLMHAQDRLPDVLRPLSVSVEVATSQPASDGALTFRLRIDNGGANDVSVKNPYDLISYAITNQDGWPVAMAAPSSKTSKVRGPVGDNRGHYLKVVAIASGGQAVDDPKAPFKKAVTVPAGSNVTYDFEIERIVPPPNDPEGPTTLVPGSYGVTWQLLLLSHVAADPAGATLVTKPATIVMR